MVDVTIPAGAVAPSNIKDTITVIANATIAAGKSVYRDATNGRKAALADASVEASAEAIGIAVNDAESGEPVTIALSGNSITVAGAAFTKGLSYWVSATAGGIAPEADLLAAEYKTLLGVASSTTVLKLNVYISGITE